MSIVASFSPTGETVPSMNKIKDDWAKIIKITSAIQTAGHDVTFHLFGPETEDNVKNLPKNHSGRFNRNYGEYLSHYNLTSGQFENALGDKLTEYILQVISRQGGTNPFNYFTVMTSMVLDEGQTYYLYTTPGLGQLIMFPTRSPARQVNQLIPLLFPSSGNPIRPFVGAENPTVKTTNDFYKVYQATESKADFLKKQE